MSEWTLGELREKNLDDLALMVKEVKSANPAANFYTAELQRRASLATIKASQATEATARWTKASAIAITLTVIVTAIGIVVSFYRQAAILKS